MMRMKLVGFEKQYQTLESVANVSHNASSFFREFKLTGDSWNILRHHRASVNSLLIMMTFTRFKKINRG